MSKFENDLKELCDKRCGNCEGEGVFCTGNSPICPDCGGTGYLADKFEKWWEENAARILCRYNEGDFDTKEDGFIEACKEAYNEGAKSNAT